MKRNKTHFFAAVLGLAMLACLLAMPASAATANWAAGKEGRIINHETETGNVSAPCTLWLTERALLDEGMIILEALRANLAAYGAWGDYQGYYEGGVPVDAYIGIGNGGQIYWYTEADYNYVDGFWNACDTVIDWDTGVITCATGAVTAINGTAKPVAASTETTQTTTSVPSDGGVDLLAGVQSFFAGVVGAVRGLFQAA
jgi:hypothetical protein